ncbi:hypothetical protein PN497_14300 [Sphaerospermopsis kisseleviana CS-549]|uniref:Uncharacterized protein n=1 Tax=Sphaerospermopsis kisseleviana CS-549 TaxID=3021783 RepID=A0ABT4ZU48_9CYAN|nr:hypothetical protein [Sphaerospermopsis kisseleviana]MDB9442524.1 hypothetical protein [Sphaerospermopsis kisseleviana CS-549]
MWNRHPACYLPISTVTCHLSPAINPRFLVDTCMVAVQRVEFGDIQPAAIA